MQRVRREHRGVPVRRGEAAELRLDLVRPDPGRVEHRGALGQLRRRCGRGGGGGATLAIEADALDPAVGGDERDAHQVAAGSAAGGAIKGAGGRGAAAGVVGEVLLEELAVHKRNLGGSNLPFSAPAW